MNTPSNDTGTLRPTPTLTPLPYATWAKPPVAYAPPLHPLARGPLPHECQLCGFMPARARKITQIVGMVFLFQTTDYSGVYCRNCGLEVFRKAQNITLIAGWWGLISFIGTVLALITNAISSVRARDLAGPTTRDPMVVTPNAYPLPVGAPLITRPGSVALAFLLALLVLVNVL